MPLNAALGASQAGTPKFVSFILFVFEVLQFVLIVLSKGQIISKGLFGVLKFSQNMNEQIRSFDFWENSRIPKVLSKLSDL